MINDQTTGEIILYQPDETVRLEVRLERETVWLNRQQMAYLFDRDIKTIGKHINNALKEELRNFSVVAKFATTADDGKTYQTEHYSLEDTRMQLELISEEIAKLQAGIRLGLN